MALVIKDRVRETSTSGGTGAITLAGAAVGYQTFSVIGDGNATYYTIVDAYGSWEVGIGTYTASGTTLSRDVVLSSSNSGSLVDFPVDVAKDVFCTYPAERAVTQSVPVTYTADFTVAPGDTWIISNKTIAPSFFTTLDPAQKAANATLSNGNLTIASSLGGDVSARSTTSKNSGKFYFEVLVDAIDVGYWNIGGIGLGNPNSYDSWAGNFAYGVTSDYSFGLQPIPAGYFTWSDGVSAATAFLNPQINDVVMFAVDFDTGTAWYGVNGVWDGDPAIGTPGINTYTFPASSTMYAYGSQANAGQTTMRFEAASFSYSLPSGFSAWGASAPPMTITLPAASDYPGRALTIQNYQDQTVVSAASNVVPIGGGAAGTAILDPVAGNSATLVSDGTNWVTVTTSVNNALLLE